MLDGRYRLLRRLGSGGMAAVWVACDERLGRNVAVKILSDLLVGDEDYRRRFEREPRVAARLNHPGLVAIQDFIAKITTLRLSPSAFAQRERCPALWSSRRGRERGYGDALHSRRKVA